MPLTVEEIREIFKEPRNRPTIAAATRHEERLRFHSETTLSRFDTARAATDFLEWVRGIIPADKYAVFLHLFRFPVKTAELTEQMYSALEKIFDGRNPVQKYDFLSPEAAADWEEYRTEQLKEPHVWQTDGMDAMKTAINSVLIVDLPPMQSGPRPDPYFYFLPVAEVIDFQLTGRSAMEWIAFKQPDDRVAFFDDAFLRVFQTKDGREITALEREVPHDLGYCPARFFWTTPMKPSAPALKKSPISNQLGDLDWLLFYGVSKRQLDTYASYPIYWGYSQDCDYDNQDTGEYCHGGFLKRTDETYVINRTSGAVVECPVCSKKRVTGAGSFVDVPPPAPENGNVDLRDPVGIVSIDRASLDYNVEEVERLKEEIYRSVTGYGGEPVNDQAVNEKQVIAAFESRTAVLKAVKKNFEAAQKWVTETICRLRYGVAFRSASINYGTEFYLYTPEYILEAYKSAKEAGADDAILDMLQEQYYETKYRNNPEQLARVKVLINLDPFRHLMKSEVREMYAAGQVAFPDFMLKVNFSTYITRFERENTNLVDFADALEFDQKIDRIRAALLGYIQQPKIQTIP